MGLRVLDSTQLRPDQLGSFAVYLYGEAAQTPSRQTLPAIRAGEYEALPEKVLPHIGGLGVRSVLPCHFSPWGEWVGLGPLHLTTKSMFPQLKQAEWVPDFGPSSFVPSWGATVTGARKFLIAFNINLLSTKEQAHRIALNLREQGRGKDQVGSFRLAVPSLGDLPWSPLRRLFTLMSQPCGVSGSELSV